MEIDVKNNEGKTEKKALTLLPRGSEQGATFQSDQTFFILPNCPVSFQLLTSHVRLHDPKGELVPIEDEEMQRLPPIHTVLRYGRKPTQADIQQQVAVRLEIHLTAIGTIEIWLNLKTPTIVGILSSNSGLPLDKKIIYHRSKGNIRMKPSRSSLLKQLKRQLDSSLVSQTLKLSLK